MEESDYTLTLQSRVQVMRHFAVILIHAEVQGEPKPHQDRIANNSVLTVRVKFYHEHNSLWAPL